jgi:transposase
MANQYRQQEQYCRSDWYEDREDHERADYTRRRPLTFNEHNEQVIEERLQVYDWEMMHLNDHMEQMQQIYDMP